jgi:hypothetical protein
MKRSFLSLALLAALTCGLVYAQSPVPVAPSAAGPSYGPSAFVYGLPVTRSEPAASDLAKAYVHADKKDKKQEIRKKLDEVLSKQFDQHMEHQKKELDDLEKQIEQLKATLKKRQEAKGTIVERRADQLINEAEGLGWTTPSAPRGGGMGGSGGFGGSRSWSGPSDALPRPGVSSAPGKLEVR